MVIVVDETTADSGIAVLAAGKTEQDPQSPRFGAKPEELDWEVVEIGETGETLAMLSAEWPDIFEFSPANVCPQMFQSSLAPIRPPSTGSPLRKPYATLLLSRAGAVG